MVELVRAGGAQKIVAADQSVIALEESPRLAAVLEEWAVRAPESTRFLFCRSGVAFLGATPERLVERRATTVRSQALAGTLPKQAVASGTSSDFEQRLLGNPKEQHEHEFVVRHIVERLEPLCSEVVVDEEPRILELRDMLHLQTPVSGVLDEPLHVLDLVKVLHPTPAVCGCPSPSLRIGFASARWRPAAGTRLPLAGLTPKATVTFMWPSVRCFCLPAPRRWAIHLR